MYLFTSFSKISSFSVPADALPWAPTGFKRNLEFLYLIPPIDDPFKLGSYSKFSILSIF